MNKYLLAGIGVVLVILVIIKIVLMNVNMNNILELTYQTNGGVPYEWKYEIEDNSIVEFVESKVINDQNKNGVVGAPITTAYVFRGLKEGQTKIIFRYVSLINGECVKEVINNVKVDKDKKILLEKNLEN